jgi:acyl transferase domain-containing protein
MSEKQMEDNLTGFEIAVIGMAGRFPKAKNIDEFWSNLVNGKESITFFTDEELREAGIGEDILSDPDFIKAMGWLDGVDYFDASFFGYTPSDAEIMDPQIRILHECTHEALENAGYDPFSYKKLIGLYAGASGNFGWQVLVVSSGRSDIAGRGSSQFLSDKDFLVTRVAHKLNLKGPAVIMSSACSTSLVAVHMACQGLIAGDCDMALAGGVSVGSASRAPYRYIEGMMYSPDGHTRPFDARGQGTIFGNAVGLVVLKRLEDALEDGDTVHAVIKGSAINNDGSGKAAYTAPSVEGQARVIRAALRMAEVDPETIGYIETHGTATALGDPVEIEGLKTAFNTDKKHFCRIGAVKSNVGHLEIASGIAGFVKTVLTLKYRLIPPTLFFETPNPKIDFENSPFVVNKDLTPWEPVDGRSLRAGVSAFGIGGTNAHVVLEEAPPQKKYEGDMPGYKLLLLSARSEAALEDTSKNLAQFLEKNRNVDLADASFTLQVGRRVHQHRWLVICRDVDEALKFLASAGSEAAPFFFAKEDNPPLAFIFPDRGVPSSPVMRELYRQVPAVREEMDRCFRILSMFPSLEGTVELGIPDDADLSFPAFFIFEYALARLLMRWGIEPHKMEGSGIGAYTAACLSGALPLEEILTALAAEGRGVPIPTPMQEKAKQFYPSVPESENNFVRLELGPVPGEDGERFLLKKIGRLWLHGVRIDWTTFYEGRRRRRIPLPTYPFQRRRYRVDIPPGRLGRETFSLQSSPRKESSEPRFFIPSWKRAPLSLTDPVESTGENVLSRWLVFMDEHGLGERLKVKLSETGNGVIVVKFGNAFEKTDPWEYHISPWEPRDYIRLVRGIRESGNVPTDILHLAAVKPVKDILYRSFYSLLYLALALGKHDVIDDIRLTVVCGPIEDITGVEPLDPEAAMVIGAVNVIPQEYPGIGCRIIDIDISGPTVYDRELTVRRLMEEIASPPVNTHVAYRGNHRWIREFEPVIPGTAKETAECCGFKHGGGYLITGGTDNSGLEAARHLARTVSAKLILVARSPLPPPDRWDRSEDPKIKKLKELEESDAEVLILDADVSDEEAMRRVFDAAEERFGAVDGVVHAAGIVRKETFNSTWNQTEDSYTREFRTGLHALPVLEKVMLEREVKPGFCLLMSSISAVLGGMGCIVDSAVSAYMDAFAVDRGHTSPIRWISIDWDKWKIDESDRGILDPAEGFDAMRRILEWDRADRVVVSSGSFHERLHRWIRGEPLEDGSTFPPLPGGVSPRKEELEQIAADTWREILNLERVGPNTDFLELGAASIDVLRVNRRLSKRLRRYIPIDVMFKYPSASSLAAYLSSNCEVEPVREEKLTKATKRMENTFQRLKEMKNG